MKKVENIFAESRKSLTFAPSKQTVRLAQLVRASDCGSEGRGFDPHTSPLKRRISAPLFYSPLLRSAAPGLTKVHDGSNAAEN